VTFDELLQRCALLERENAAQQKELSAKDQAIALKDQEIELLRYELKQRLAELYGRRRERFEGHPRLPFEESGLETAIDENPQKWEAPDEETIEVAAHERRPRRIARLPENLPHEIETIELPAEDRQCHLCHGEMEPMGYTPSQRLDYRPARYVVKETRRVKYSCPRCHEGVISAPLPTQAIERGLAAAGLLSHVVVSKYVDHLPLHRLEGIFAREGIEVSKSTMCDWVAGAASRLEPLVDLLRERVLVSYVIQTDDTPITVLERAAKGGSRRSYLWCYLGDEGDVVIDFTAGRGREGPSRMLHGYQGYLQADAYSGYHEVFARQPVVEVGCWAHARRYFFDAKDLHKGECEHVLKRIGALYAIEAQARECQLSFVEREALRAEKSKPILAELRRWLLDHKDRILPKSPLGQAIGYAMHQWEALNRYAGDGRLSIDNNASERTLRHIAVGRKNWVFAGSHEGGRRAATIYSIVMTCKRNGVEPFAYLAEVFERIPACPRKDLWRLTPRGWKEARAPK
jgi:transposase